MSFTMPAELGVGPDHLKAVNQFIAKSDGKDKLCATIQYACLFLAAGEPGNISKIKASVAAARKVFRILKPLESLTPLLLHPGFAGTRPLLIETIGKLKCLLMAGYFGADHIVWSGQAGLVKDPVTLQNFQRFSTYCWFGGSLCSIANEVYELSQLCLAQQECESEEEWQRKQADVNDAIHRRSLVLIHACFQAALAVGLLQLAPIKTRTVGLIGVITSALNCYMMFPALPKPVTAARPLDAAASSLKQD
eukprot:evm.model.scf_1727.6 EVM.evm.TU.scf_1727.6   scf_1727:30146-33515(+)